MIHSRREFSISKIPEERTTKSAQTDNIRKEQKKTRSERIKKLKENEKRMTKALNCRRSTVGHNRENNYFQ